MLSNVERDSNAMPSYGRDAGAFGSAIPSAKWFAWRYFPSFAGQSTKSVVARLSRRCA